MHYWRFLIPILAVLGAVASLTDRTLDGRQCLDRRERDSSLNSAPSLQLDRRTKENTGSLLQTKFRQVYRKAPSHIRNDFTDSIRGNGEELKSRKSELRASAGGGRASRERIPDQSARITAPYQHSRAVRSTREGQTAVTRSDAKNPEYISTGSNSAAGDRRLNQDHSRHHSANAAADSVNSRRTNLFMRTAHERDFRESMVRSNGDNARVIRDRFNYRPYAEFRTENRHMPTNSQDSRLSRVKKDRENIRNRERAQPIFDAEMSTRKNHIRLSRERNNNDGTLRVTEPRFRGEKGSRMISRVSQIRRFTDTRERTHSAKEIKLRIRYGTENARRSSNDLLQSRKAGTQLNYLPHNREVRRDASKERTRTLNWVTSRPEFQARHMKESRISEQLNINEVNSRDLETTRVNRIQIHRREGSSRPDQTRPATSNIRHSTNENIFFPENVLNSPITWTRSNRFVEESSRILGVGYQEAMFAKNNFRYRRESANNRDREPENGHSAYISTPWTKAFPPYSFAWKTVVLTALQGIYLSAIIFQVANGNIIYKNKDKSIGWLPFKPRSIKVE